MLGSQYVGMLGHVLGVLRHVRVYADMCGHVQEVGRARACTDMLEHVPVCTGLLGCVCCWHASSCAGMHSCV